MLSATSFRPKRSRRFRLSPSAVGCPESARSVEQTLRKEQLLLLDWTKQHRPLLAPERPFDMEQHKYLVDLYNQTARRVVVCKAGQVGISEYLVSHALWSADERSATVLYIFPTEAHVSDLSSARIGRSEEHTSELQSRLHLGC